METSMKIVLLALNTFLLLIQVIQCLPFNASDSYVSPCSFLPDSLATGPISAPYQGFKLWSQASTWPSGNIPGIGDNVTIPCGTAVLLDVSSVTLSLLRVQGLLRFLDDPKLPSIYVKSNFILVEGQVTIGSPSQQFSQQATIELTPNLAGGRATLKFSSFLPADPKNPRDFGEKVFAVVGGQVHLHGLPAASTMPVWARLSNTANANVNSISIDANVAGLWPIGSQIVVTSTDYARTQAEIFTIVNVVGGGSTSTITLSNTTQFMHYGLPQSLPDGYGGFVEQRAEVALLSRNIVITGTQETAPNDLKGGHFMVYMTPTVQYIEGVRLYRMGQQGKLGRYPIHFHINGNTPNSVCRKNTIHESNQRCIVIHATHNMTIDSNVSYKNKGHCYIVEEGGEMGNTFINNLGIVTEPVQTLISATDTDNTPATFWITNPQNNLISNVAAGSSDSGFWIELRYAVRGDTLQIPSLGNMKPISMNLGTYVNNVAHSNDVAGFRTYPHGLRPRYNQLWNGAGVPGTISGLNSYKNGWMGMFIHNTDYLTVSSSVFSDNYWGVFMHQDNNVSLVNSRLIALTANLGNPSTCSRGDLWAPCRPAQPTAGCQMPLAPGVPGRSTANGEWNASVLGVLMDADSRFQSLTSSGQPDSIQNTTFSFYDSSCWPSSSILLVNNGEGEFWNSAHNVQNVQFTADSTRVVAAPKKTVFEPWAAVVDGLEVSQFYNLWDKTGSIMGTPGYIVANNTNILPPSPNNCVPNTSSNAYFCPSACYRTVRIIFRETGFSASAQNVDNLPGSFSYLNITRVSDQISFVLYGNLRQTRASNDLDYSPDQRFFAFSVPAGQQYIVSVIPGTQSPSFVPVNLTAGYVDFSGCGVGLSLLFKPPPNSQWVPSAVDDHWMGAAYSEVFSRQCYGSVPLPNTAQYGPVCVNGLQWTQIDLGLSVASPVLLTLAAASSACAASFECSLVWSGQPGWQYDAAGLNIRPQFYNPLYTGMSQTGLAPLGQFKWDSTTVKTHLPPASATLLTYYFKKTFSVQNTACLTALNIQLVEANGVVLYLNNREVLRANMPAGAISNSTLAVTELQFPYWTKISLPLPGSNNSYFLVEGVNYLAAELHVVAPWETNIAFDLRISAVTEGGACKGAYVSPEVCDGVDNNNDGKVDLTPSGLPLTAPCQTACGAGTATCVSGSYQKCSAPATGTEICNGVDDDCDGLVDNGPAALNCGAGSVCSQGKCLPVTPVSAPLQLWPKNATSWLYYDRGGNLNSANANWKNGVGVASWKQGQGPLGFDQSSPPRPWNKLGTNLRVLTQDGVSTTAYFLKSFSLTAAQLSNSFSLSFNLRRVDGAVVYLNGNQLWSSNMPVGAVQWNTLAASGMGAKEWSPGTNCCNLEWLYYACDNCTHKSAQALKAGVNWLAVEVHVAWLWKGILTFDMDLTWNGYSSCSSLPRSPATCARSVHQMIFPLSSTGWKYADASLPFPPLNWASPSFIDSSWKQGQAPIGHGSGLTWLLNSTLNGGSNSSNLRAAYYFRKTIQITDANCYFQINSTLLANDGAVVYFNGVEAYRKNLPTGGVISPTTFASNWGNWNYLSQVLSGGWLRVGSNTVAVELHRHVDNNGAFFFDMQLEGFREGRTCSPMPV